MQPTLTLVSLLLAATGTNAIPSSPISERQLSGVNVAFYSGRDCTGQVEGFATWVDNGSNACSAFDGPDAYQSVYFLETSTNTRPLRAYGAAGCDENSTHNDFQPGQTGCQNVEAIIESTKWV